MIHIETKTINKVKTKIISFDILHIVHFAIYFKRS